MSGQSGLHFYPISSGYVVRVVGRGTLQQSPTLRDFTLRCVQKEGLIVVLDLSACGYLDSTFLGCLVGLNQNCCPAQNRQFQVFVDVEGRGRLFGVSQVDTLLHFVDDLPDSLQQSQELNCDVVDNSDLGRHVMEAHERLAGLGGPDAEGFKSVADRMAADLRRREDEE